MIREINRCFLEHLFELHQVDCFIYDEKLELDFHIGNLGQYNLNIPYDLRAKLYKKAENSKSIVLEMEESSFLYGAFLDKDKKIYIFGPVIWRNLESSQRFDFNKRFGISLKETKLPNKRYKEFVNIMSVAYIQVNQESVLSINDIDGDALANIDESDLMEYCVERSFSEKQRNHRKLEKENYEAVLNGNTDFFKQKSRTKGGELDRVGILAKNNYKQIEYLFVTVLALTRAVAVEGGMKYGESCDLSDLYLQRLERCRNVLDILNLLDQMRIDYAQRVNILNKTQNKKFYIEYCKDYITQHITLNIQEYELAKSIGLSPEYLSKIFSESEGISITEYRIKKKLEAAKNQLKYSQRSITEIAEYFSFSSASRFGSYFKKEYGMTPLQYRKHNQSPDFIAKDL